MVIILSAIFENWTVSPLKSGHSMIDWSVITVEDWALIRRLDADGVPKARIAARLGVSRTTVIKAVASDAPPKYVRKSVESSFAAFEPMVSALLAAEPDLPAVVLANRVGWAGSESWFRANVARLRPEHRRVDPVDRLVWTAGDVIQCDLWFPPFKIPLEDGRSVLLPVLVMVCAFSRFMMARMIPSKTGEDLLLGMWWLLRQLGAVTHRLIWDNEAAIGRGRVTEVAQLFAGALATRIVLCKPYDPETKGIVERRNGWFEKSFMPGRVFVSPADFNGQLTSWLELANSRVVRTTGARPVDLLAADKAKMLPLPPAVFGLGWSNRVRLGRDYYVSIAGNDYSVDPTAIGRFVDVHADLNRVQARLDGRLVGEHDRLWMRGQTVTDPAHVAKASVLRAAYQTPRPLVFVDDTLTRDLTVYDQTFGLDEMSA